MSDERKIVLFALTTCNACKKTNKLLDSHHIDYLCVDMDTVDRKSREDLLIKMRPYNPRETVPTLVINSGEKVVVGYGEDNLKEALGL